MQCKQTADLFTLQEKSNIVVASEGNVTEMIINESVFMAAKYLPVVQLMDFFSGLEPGRIMLGPTWKMS